MVIDLSTLCLVALLGAVRHKCAEQKEGGRIGWGGVGRGYCG